MNVLTHPRASIVDEARNELELFLLNLAKKHELTYGELFSLLGNSIKNLAMYQIRRERHPNDPEKGGDDA